MIALKFLSFTPLLLFLYLHLAQCYPNTYYGDKRYSRSTHKASYDDDYYLKNQRYPYNYYPSYAQLYPEEYYYSPDSYPMYYVTPRAPKYDIYKASLPYYYPDVPVSRVPSKYNYYNYPDPNVDEQERLLQEYEIEQREKSQPIGHEIRYEGDYNTDDDEGVDETNAAFLNNLMMQQMYHDKVPAPVPSYYDQYPYTDYSSDETDSVNFPTKWDDVPYDRPVKVEDENVKELQDLSKKQKQRKNKQRKQRKQKNNIDESPSKRSQDNVVYTDRKPIVNAFPTPLPTEGPKRDARGQKEEVLMRPATPVRHPFSDSVLEMINQQEQQKRSPSVYDTIRHMLEMEKKYDEDLQDAKPEVRQTMKKRIVSSEDSLTRQLSVLKKTQ